MIEVRDLTKRFGNFTAVDRVSFAIPTGQTLALIGTSGSGKTTTLKMINRLIEPSGGQILVNEEDVTNLPAHELRRNMGYVIQDMGLFPHYTVYDNIALVPRLLEKEESWIRDRVFSLMEKLHLPADQYAAKYPRALSGGQQQRVGIARALAADPPIILMDEPFGALDPITRQDIRREFRDLEDLASKTIIMVTHDVEEAFEMGDQVCLLDEGVIQQLGTPKDLLFRPANDFVREFLAGQKLQLEMETVRLGDLFPYLPTEQENGTRQIIAFKKRDTLLAAITRLTKVSNLNRSGHLAVDNQERYFAMPELMDAYYQFLAH